jgi:hypothetical protein
LTSQSDIVEALSLERFGRYLAWAGGDRQRTIDLYTLNTALSESLYTPLQMLEVALRNRIHTVLSAAVTDHWFDDPAFQLGTRQPEQLAKAKQDLADENKAVTPGRLVAALTFGYWTSFFGLSQFWTGGSKQPAIRHLLEGVLNSGTGRFSKLIIKIVERSITYRKRKDPLTRAEIERLNELLLKIGFKIPELHDPAFLGTFADTGSHALIFCTSASDTSKLA